MFDTLCDAEVWHRFNGNECVCLQLQWQLHAHAHTQMHAHLCTYVCMSVHLCLSSLCNALSPIFNCRIVLPTHRQTRMELLSPQVPIHPSASSLRCSLLILVINWRWCRTSCAGLLKGLQDVNARGNSINANSSSICGLSRERGTRNKINYERLSKYPTHTHEYMCVHTYVCTHWRPRTVVVNARQCFDMTITVETFFHCIVECLINLKASRSH